MPIIFSFLRHPPSENIARDIPAGKFGRNSGRDEKPNIPTLVDPGCEHYTMLSPEPFQPFVGSGPLAVGFSCGDFPD